MGVWGAALFSNDVACDIRDHYRDLIADGVEDAEATRLTVEKFQAWLGDADDGTSCILALAVTQSKIGRLDAGICDARRKQVLARVREQLTGPQPIRSRVKRPSRSTWGLAAGDVLALDCPGGLALLRVVRVHVHRKGETPCLEELQFSGAQLPSQEIMERLEAMVKPSSAMLQPDARLFALPGIKNAGWKEAGFRKVATIRARAGDAESALPSYGIRWPNLAERYLKSKK
jgi:hypothetical protein